MAKFGVPTGGNSGGGMFSEPRSFNASRLRAPAIKKREVNNKKPTPLKFKDKFLNTVRFGGDITAGRGVKDKLKDLGTNVKAKASVGSSLIQSISTNINNQFGDAINQLQNNVTNIVNPVLGRLKAEHRRSIDDAESNKPTNLLGGFLDMLRSGLDFIKFLSDRKRLAFLRKGIKSLKGAFNELFQVGESVAKTLKKLIKRIQEISKEGGGGGGGFNPLDLLRRRRPGGNKRRFSRTPTSRTPRRNMFRGKGRGLAAAGGLALGTGALMGLMPQEARGQDETEVEPEENVVQTGQLISKESLEKFDQVLDAFDKAIALLAKPDSPDTGSPSAPAGSPTSPSAQPTSTPMGGGGGGSIDASKIDADSPQAKALVATIREVEGTAHEKGYDTWFGGRTDMKMTDMTLQEVYDEQTRRMNAGETTYNGLSSAAVGVGQFMDPLNQARAMYAARGEAFDPTKIKFDEKLQNDLLLDLAARKRGIDPSKTLTKEDFDVLQLEWAGLGTYHGQTGRTTADSLRIYQENLREAGSSVVAAEEPAQKMTQVAKSVSQPANKGGGVSVVPIGGSSSQQQSGGGGGSAQPQKDNGGIPFFGSSSEDNAHDMFSRMTYNVVG